MYLLDQEKLASCKKAVDSLPLWTFYTVTLVSIGAF